MPATWTPRAFCRPATLEWWTVTLLAFYLIALWDFSALDGGVMLLIGNAHGFPLRESFWLATVGHEWLHDAAVLAWLLLWLAVLWPLGALRRFTRRERLMMALGTTAALVLVGLIKRHSATSCPWDLQVFGGPARWVSHWDWSIGFDGGPGRCFPGGHASGALAFVALAWPGLEGPPSGARWRFGCMALLLSLGAGLLFGVVQTLRGAHPPSHTAWTAWLCWTSTGLLHALQRRWAVRSGTAHRLPP